MNEQQVEAMIAERAPQAKPALADDDQFPILGGQPAAPAAAPPLPSAHLSPHAPAQSASQDNVQVQQLSVWAGTDADQCSVAWAILPLSCLPSKTDLHRLPLMGLSLYRQSTLRVKCALKATAKKVSSDWSTIVQTQPEAAFQRRAYLIL